MYDFEDDEVDQGALKCTPKCQTALTSETTLTCRTRQYCLLLARGDELSQQVSQKLSAKIDVPALLQAGYLESDNPEFNNSQTTRSEANSIKGKNLESNNGSETVSSESSYSDDNLVGSSASKGLFKQCVNSSPSQHAKPSLEEGDISPTLQWIAGNH